MVPLVNYNNNNSVVHWYKNMTELANQQVHDLNAAHWREIINEGKSEHYSLRWYGVRGGIPEFRKYCELEGWMAGVDKGLKAIGDLPIPRLPTFRRKKVRSSSGNALDIHRVYGGDLAHAWESTKREQSLHKMAFKGHVNIIIDLCAAYNVSAEAMFWRGALGCLLAKALVASGRHVRIIAAASIDDLFSYNSDDAGYEKATAALVVKDWNYPIELNSLFATTALAGFFRYYFFKSYLSIPKLVRDGIGHPISVQLNHLDFYLDTSATIVIENIWNANQAITRAEAFKKQIEEGKQYGNED